MPPRGWFQHTGCFVLYLWYRFKVPCARLPGTQARSRGKEPQRLTVAWLQNATSKIQICLLGRNALARLGKLHERTAFCIKCREQCTCRTVLLRGDVDMLCICGIGWGTMDWDSTCAPPTYTHTHTQTHTNQHAHVIVVDVVIRALLLTRLQIFRENRVEWRCRNRFGNTEYSIAPLHVGRVGR